MVVIGLMLVTGLNGFLAGFEALLIKQLGTIGADTITVTPASNTSFELNDVSIRQLQAIPGVTTTIPFLQRTATIQSGSDIRNVTVLGIDSSLISIIYPTVKVKEGDLLSSNDTTGFIFGDRLSNPKDLDYSFANINSSVKLTSGSKDGSSTRGTFVVKGVFDYVGAPNIDNTAFLSLKAAQNHFNTGSEYSGVYLISDPSRVEEVEESVSELFGKDVIVFSPKAVAEAVNEIFSSIEIFYGFITGISLLVATIGIVITLYTSVTERIREIGVMKSIGYTNGMILYLFLTEAIIIGIIGGTIGILGGIGIAYAIPLLINAWSSGSSNSDRRFEDSGDRGFGGGGGPGDGEFFTELVPVFEPSTIITFWLFAVALSIIAGVFPAWKGSKLNPIEALRRE
tara:strand:- start:92 stop:1285 length:1194 start_codon:yes stop_codon:yes gene_type:complete